METPLVTIVTPSLNQGQFIRATIESVLAQDYPSIEYLIMDGGSTDETTAIAAEFARRLKFVSEPDRGQASAINKGFRQARGEIIAWLNSDDILLPGAVSKAVRALTAHPEAAAVYGEGYRLDEDGRNLGRFPFTEPFNLWKLVHLVDYVLQQSLFMRRDAVAEAGYLDETLRYTLDWDLLIRLGKRRPLHYTPEFLGAIREHPSAKSFAGGAERLREIASLFRQHTGSEAAPGVQLYSLERWRRRWWSAPFAGRRADRLRREAQGLYADGWAAPRLLYMLPPGDGSISISGVSPLSQELTVIVNGDTAGRFPVPAASFAIQVPARGLAHLEIRASRSLRPASDEIGPPRRLAWVLKSIDWD